MIKMSNNAIISKNEEIQGKNRAELEEMLSRFGWKWAVLASTAGGIHQRGAMISKEHLNQIRMSKTQIESGCYSVCDIAVTLREIEKELFSTLINHYPKETDTFLELIGKAIGGKISEKDLNLPGAKPILQDCAIPCVCRE